MESWVRIGQLLLLLMSLKIMVDPCDASDRSALHEVEMDFSTNC
jgi:hypothetical protein